MENAIMWKDISGRDTRVVCVDTGFARFLWGMEKVILHVTPAPG